MKKAILELNDRWPRKTWSQLPPEEYLIPHLGQRKLLIAEIAFLAIHGSLSNKVVYAGAAPGPHIKILAELFPKHKFYLFDPQPFDTELRGKKNIKIHQTYFTETWCTKFTGCLFISDIRSAGTDHQEEVAYNLRQQATWCDHMHPIMASLKFRMPFTKTNEILEYFDGDVMLQAWSKRDSTETRLWTKCTTKKNWSTHDFEEKMFHYNSELRLGDYNVGQLVMPGMDCCNDCAIEWTTWKLLGDPAQLIEQYPSQSFNLPPHGQHATTPRSERVKLLAESAREFYKKYEHHEESRKKYYKPTKRN